MAASGDVCGREWHGSSDMIILFVCVLALVDDPPSASRACECMPAWQDTLYATFYTFGFGLFLFARALWPGLCGVICDCMLYV